MFNYLKVIYLIGISVVDIVLYFVVIGGLRWESKGGSVILRGSTIRKTTSCDL